MNDLVHQCVRRLFVLEGIKNNRKYFFLRRKFENYNVLIDGRNFYDPPLMT